MKYFIVKFILISYSVFGLNHAAQGSNGEVPFEGVGSPPQTRTILYDKSTTPGSQDPAYPWYNPKSTLDPQPVQKKVLFMRHRDDPLMNSGFIEIVPYKRPLEVVCASTTEAQYLASLVFVTDSYKTKEELENYIRKNKENYPHFDFSFQHDKKTDEFFAYVVHSAEMLSYMQANSAARFFQKEYDLEVLGASDSKDAHLSTDSEGMLSDSLEKEQESLIQDGVNRAPFQSFKKQRASANEDDTGIIDSDPFTTNSTVTASILTNNSVKPLGAPLQRMKKVVKGKSIANTGGRKSKNKKQIIGQTNLDKFGFC